MESRKCAHCGKEWQRQSGAAFCPFCGGALQPEATGAGEPEAALALLRKVEGMTDLRKKYALLQEAEAEYPQSLAIAQELLHMGRLYQRGGKQVDFSIIKCFLLKLYLSPEEFSKERQEEMRQELFQHPQLQKCLALAQDEDAFLRAYLLRLSSEFITLFLRGDSRYMRRIFGFGLEGRAPKLLAAPVADMLAHMRQDTSLSLEQREMLMQQLYQAFSRDMGGETEFLDELLHKGGTALPGRA